MATSLTFSSVVLRFKVQWPVVIAEDLRNFIAAHIGQREHWSCFLARTVLFTAANPLRLGITFDQLSSRGEITAPGAVVPSVGCGLGSVERGIDGGTSILVNVGGTVELRYSSPSTH